MQSAKTKSYHREHLVGLDTGYQLSRHDLKLGVDLGVRIDEIAELLVVQGATSILVRLLEQLRQSSQKSWLLNGRTVANGENIRCTKQLQMLIGEKSASIALNPDTNRLAKLLNDGARLDS